MLVGDRSGPGGCRRTLSPWQPQNAAPLAEMTERFDDFAPSLTPLGGRSNGGSAPGATGQRKVSYGSDGVLMTLIERMRMTARGAPAGDGVRFNRAVTATHVFSLSTRGLSTMPMRIGVVSAAQQLTRNRVRSKPAPRRAPGRR